MLSLKRLGLRVNDTESMKARPSVAPSQFHIAQVEFTTNRQVSFSLEVLNSQQPFIQIQPNLYEKRKDCRALVEMSPHLNHDVIEH